MAVDGVGQRGQRLQRDDHGRRVIALDGGLLWVHDMGERAFPEHLGEALYDPAGEGQVRFQGGQAAVQFPAAVADGGRHGGILLLALLVG
jgi:hypothetical protein